MTRRRVALLIAGVAAVVFGLAQLALMHAHPGAFASHWYWQNDSVGNFADDVTLAALGGWKVVREWKAHRAHQARLERHLLRIHAHLGIDPEDDHG